MMKINRALFTVFFMASLLFLTDAFSDGWKAGVSSALITPREPMFTAGYGNRKEPSSGIISDIFIKAMAIEDPQGERAVIVTADLIGYYPFEFPLEISSEVEKNWGIPRKSIFYNASHTHCAPRIHGTGTAEVYKEWLRGKFIEIIGQSLENLSPVGITFSSARPVPFAVSRRLPDGKGGVLYRSVPSAYYTEGPRDDTVPVLKISNSDGTVRAILFGYACHPITLNDNEISGDYPGFAQKYIEEAFPGAIALFVQGCSGELVPNARFQVEYAMGHGRALADAVIRAVEGEQKELSGPLKTSYTEVTLNFAPLPDKKALEEQLQSRNEQARTNAESLLERMEKGEEIEVTHTVPLQAVSFGPELLLLGIPGEPVSEYAVNSKMEFSDKAGFVWVAGYTNYHFGYLPTSNIQREGGYETRTWSSPVYQGTFADDVEDIVMNGLRGLVDSFSK